MPNGRSGGFVVTREELKRVLEECDGDTVIGKSLQAPVTASAVIGFLAKTRHTHIVVEEQDLEWYILRLRDWVIVDTSSVLYIPFRQFHAQWGRRLVGRHQVSRTYATFDAPESRSDPRGAELAGTIRSNLEGEFPVSHLLPRDNNAWVFKIAVRKERCLVTLQQSDTWLLVIAPLKRLLGIRSGPSTDEMVRIARSVHRALSQAQASSIRWYTVKEFRARLPGAASPEKLILEYDYPASVAVPTTAWGFVRELSRR